MYNNNICWIFTVELNYCNVTWIWCSQNDFTTLLTIQVTSWNRCDLYNPSAEIRRFINLIPGHEFRLDVKRTRQLNFWEYIYFPYKNCEFLVLCTKFYIHALVSANLWRSYRIQLFCPLYLSMISICFEIKNKILQNYFVFFAGL